MTYIIKRDDADDGDWTTTRVKNKDEVIANLVYWLRSAHGEKIRIIYPDGEEWV